VTALRMALSELRRLTAGRLPKLAVVALLLVPVLYGGLYLYANHDPYGNLDQVPAALVVLDTGATDPSGKAIDAGREVADALVDEGSFDWHEVSASAARDGVRKGRYDFALTVPADFSQALTSSARFAPEQARLTMTTNDANSYLSTTIADTVTARVRDAIASRVGSAAAEQFLLGFGEIRGSLQDAADGAGKLREGLATSASGAASLAAGAKTLRAGGNDLASGLATLTQQTTGLPARTRQLSDGAVAVANGNAKVATIGDDIRQLSSSARSAFFEHRAALQNRMIALGLTGAQRTQLLAIYDQLATPINDVDSAVASGAAQLDALSTGATRVASGAATLAASMPALTSAIAKAHSGAEDLASGAADVQNGAATLDTGLSRMENTEEKRKDGCGRRQQPPPGPEGLATAGDLHRLDIVAHVKLPEPRHALPGSKGELGPLKIFLRIGFDAGIGSHNHAFDVVIPILAPHVFQ